MRSRLSPRRMVPEWKTSPSTAPSSKISRSRSPRRLSRLVRPLQILDDEDQRPFLGDEGQDLVQHLPELLLAGRPVGGEGEAQETAQHRNRAGEPRGTVEEEALERLRRVHASQSEVLPERVRERQ